MGTTHAVTEKPVNSPRRVLLASMIGTAIEYFDFYIYATAAVLVFPHLFFSQSIPGSAILASLATFGIAFVARPVGSALFGHFGDRVGRKATLVLALSTMGVSTVAIGALPGYKEIGFAAPVLLAIFRFGQGLGLGGEWGGAVLLAIENAPGEKRALYGMFPQFGAPIGFFMSGGIYLVLSRWLTDQQFLAFGWRIPFLASAILVFLGLYVRLTLAETPVFQTALDRGEAKRLPIAALFRNHGKALMAGMLVCLSIFVVFYILDVFSLSWGTSVLGYNRSEFLLMQMCAAVSCALMIPVGAYLAERGRRRTMMWATAASGVFGLAMAPMFSAGRIGALAMLVLGLSLSGLTWGPLGTVISELFPTAVRYTGSSLAFSLAGILGASLTPYIATWLARTYGLQYVGYYLTLSAALTFAGLLWIRETKDDDLSAIAP
jgi:metabolite-proton symporter